MRRLDAALASPPYTLLLHTAPVGEDGASYHWHLEIIPRLAPVPGLAWDGGLHINPVAPEEAAARAALADSRRLAPKCAGAGGARSHSAVAVPRVWQARLPARALVAR